MGKISSIEYFRVPPRWLFVKIKDEEGNVGWGEASLEGHTQAVEGCLDAWAERYVGFEAEYVGVLSFSDDIPQLTTQLAKSSTSGKCHGELPFTAADPSSCPPSRVSTSLSGT